MKLITLNIEGDNHLDRVIPFLQKENADVICMQEVLEKDLPLFSEKLGMQYSYIPLLNTDWEENAPKEKWRTYYPTGTKSGMAIFSNREFNSMNHTYGDLQEPPKRGNVLKGKRALLVSLFSGFTVITTHFTYIPDGRSVSDQQRNDVLEVLEIIRQKYPECVFCGDFNIPRPNEIYRKFTEYFADNIPQNITTTLDQNLHKAKGLLYVVDYIFSTPTYTVSDVRVIDGVSDHMAVVANITIRGV